MKFILTLTTTVAALLASPLASANVMNVAIDCKSASGRTIIAADLPGDEDDASIAISLDGKKSSFLNGEAQALATAGNEGIRARIQGGEITPAQVLIQETKSTYSATAIANGKSVFSLVSTGPISLTVDRDYGYRTGQFKAKLEAVHRGQPIKADLVCVYDYAP